jgi:cyclopropane fatty-acyl-phospholipid synthase-like methyltransferase
MTAKAFSAASERNREPILGALRDLLADCTSVLEIGSGTGQHAVHFAAAMPQLRWQTSDLAASHDSIRAWIADSGLSNVLPPLKLNVAVNDWPAGPFDAVYSANTSHIMSWPQVQAMFAGVGRVLAPGGVFCLYGPFRRAGRHTSEGNAEFDAALRSRAPHMGLRDAESVDALAREQGLELIADLAMPANNALLAWRRMR